MTQETYFTISLAKLRRKTGGKKTGKEIRGKKLRLKEILLTIAWELQRRFLIRNKCGDELEWV